MNENNGQTIDFVFDSDFDENGVIYFLGSQGKTRKFANPHISGQVKVFFSSIRTGRLEDFVSRQNLNLTT